MPADIPVTIPEPAPTVPTAGVLLLHAPKDVASVRPVVVPMHALVVPAIAAGKELTVNVAVLLLDTVMLQPAVVVIPVMVIVVDPGLGSIDVVNGPLEVPIVSVAVLPVAVFAPLRL